MSSFPLGHQKTETLLDIYLLSSSALVRPAAISLMCREDVRVQKAKRTYFVFAFASLYQTSVGKIHLARTKLKIKGRSQFCSHIQSVTLVRRHSSSELEIRTRVFTCK